MPSAPERQLVALAKPLVERVSFQNVTRDSVGSAVSNSLPVVRCDAAVYSHVSRREFGCRFLRRRRRRQVLFSARFGTESGLIHVFPTQLPGVFAP